MNNLADLWEWFRELPLWAHILSGFWLIHKAVSSLRGLEASIKSVLGWWKAGRDWFSRDDEPETVHELQGESTVSLTASAKLVTVPAGHLVQQGFAPAANIQPDDLVSESFLGS